MDYEKKDGSEKDFMQEMREKYSRAVDAAKDNYDAALDDIKFAMLGEQWDESERQKRLRKGRPCLTINKLPANIRQVVNDAR